MYYQFPTIKHIDDVLPAIKDAKEFIVAEKEGYTVINYVMAGEDTFPAVVAETLYRAPMRRECRGLIFCSETGEVLSRGYHKFFNQNERDETRDIDLSKPHVILEKLDGSMIRPLFLKGQKRPRWITKMGITEVSMQVETWLAENPELQKKYEKFALHCHELGETPIFEWCSRKQRIVLDYFEDKLVLTAIRHNESGCYGHYDMITHHEDIFNILVVKEVKMEYLDQESVEGIVIRFDDGHMVKVKTDWYVLRHKALDGLRSEKNVLKLILDNGMDDVIPLLDDSTKERVSAYVNKVNLSITTKAFSFNALAGEKRHLPRKEFALWVKTNVPTEAHSICFKVYDGQDAGDAIIEKISKNLQSQTTVDSIRPLIGATYNA